jgi:ribonuclease HI
MEYPEEEALNIYTDGSSLPKPRRGGLAALFLLINENGVEETHEPMMQGYSGATNNQMELEACVQALRAATAQQPFFDGDRFRRIVIHTDAEYIAGNYETAIFNWSKNGWLKRDDTPVDNAAQWKELVGLIGRSRRQGKPVQIKWVHGKSSPRTKIVDKAAKKRAKQAPARQLVPSEVRRKKTDRPIEIGSVGMEGQMMTINVFKTEYQRLHSLEKVWYSVLSKRSPYYRRASVIYADPALRLRRGHDYRVRVNQDTGNPRVVKVFAEVA